MNVAQVNMYDVGGAFQAAYRLQQGLRQNNINSNFLVLYQHQKNLKNVYPFMDNENILSKLKYSFEYRMVQKKIKSLVGDKPKLEFRFPFSPYKIHQHKLIANADIVHLHWMAKFLDYPSFFKNINKPVVWTLHDINPFSGGFHYDTYKNPLYEKLDYETAIVKQKILSNFKNLHIVTLSHWIHHKSKSSSVLGQFPHHYIPNGIDINIFKPYLKEEARSFFNLPQDKKIILFAADNLEDKRKGFIYLKDALKYLNKDEIFLVTLGKGEIDNDLFPSKSLGFIFDSKQIAMAYSAADVFVIPSIEDNLPNSVIESMACGTPIVGFNTGGIPDMIRDGENGYLAELKDSRSLANNINKILDSNEIQEYTNKKSREIAINEYSMELQAKRHIELYNAILNK